jgi:hypothetical protein
LGYEENESENDESKERMTENFADDVAVQDAHVKNAECNTGVVEPSKGRR